MGKCWTLAAMASVMIGLASAAYGQASITKFADVAGKWSGFANRYRVNLQIDATGRFLASSPIGNEMGEARIESGALVIPLMEHRGTLKLMLDGDSLSGPGFLAGKTWSVSLARTQDPVRSGSR